MRAVSITQAATALLPGVRPPTAARGVSSLGSQIQQRAVSPGAEADDYVARAAAGDVHAFEELYRVHLPRVHSLVRRMSGGRDSDELTQDVFVRVWQKLATFRGTRRSGPGSIGSRSTS